MKISLRSCPFCGSHNIRLKRKSRTVIKGQEERITYCYCPDCDVRGHRVLYSDYITELEAETTACNYWNRRI